MALRDNTEGYTPASSTEQVTWAKIQSLVQKATVVGERVSAPTSGLERLGSPAELNAAITAVATALDQRVLKFGTTAEVLALSESAAKLIPTGSVITTAGKTTEGDGGGGQFIIEATGTANGGTVIALADGRFIKAVGWDGSTRLFCVGDGTTDDTEALQAAADAAAGDTLHVYGTPLVTDTITITPNTNVFFHGGATLRYNGVHDRPALHFIEGDTAAENRCLVELSVESVDQSDWSNEDYIGIRIDNLYRSRCSIARAYKFTIGVQLRGDGRAVAYNHFDVGHLRDNKVQMDLYCAGATNGYVNENQFDNGRYANSSATNTAMDSYGIRFSWDGGSGYRNHNNNVFIKPCFELQNANPGVDRVPILFEGAGNFNQFRQIRAESGRGPLAIFDGQGDNFYANFNSITIGYAGGTYVEERIEERDDAYGNDLNYRYPHYNYKSVWHSGDIPSLITAYNSTNAYIRGDFHLSSSSNANISKSLSAFALVGDWVEIGGSRGIGCFVDTTMIKRLVIKLGGKEGQCGRLYLIGYDENGDIVPFTWDTIQSGCNDPRTLFTGGIVAPRAGSDALMTTMVHVSDEIKKLRVLVGGGSVPGYLNSISIIAIDDHGSLTVTSGLDHSPTSAFCSGDPSNGILGKYAKGEILYNEAAESGQPSYYQCTTAGRLAPAHVTETAYEAGQYVLSDTNKIYKCVTAGTTGAASAPTGTGTGITDGTAEWDYVSPKAVFTAGPSLA